MKKRLLPIILIVLILAGGIFLPPQLNQYLPRQVAQIQNMSFIQSIRAKIYKPKQVLPESFSLESIPEYNGQEVCVINNNQPFFTDKDDIDGIKLSPLDSLGRCGVAAMKVTKDTMPTEERGEIGMIKPSGWNQAKYPGIIKESPSYLYNRAHLLAHCLSSLNDEERNLITGTRQMNLAMVPYEVSIAEYVEKTGESVLYRVTPVYSGEDLVASGVLMEAKSKEINFCVYVYNEQEGIEINHSNGESKAK